MGLAVACYCTAGPGGLIHFEDGGWRPVILRLRPASLYDTRMKITTEIMVKSNVQVKQIKDLNLCPHVRFGCSRKPIPQSFLLYLWSSSEGHRRSGSLSLLTLQKLGDLCAL